MTDDRGHTTGTGRLATGLTWALLLSGLWLWGRGVTGVPHTSDGKVARCPTDDVRVLPPAGFDARQAYAPHHPGRAELRLITCGGAFDRTAHHYTANVVVSAYLTGTTG